MSALQTHLVVIGFLFCVSNGVAPAAERLPTDYWRQPLAPQGEAPRSWTPEERSLTPESCGACHGDKLEEWRTSLHAKGFSPGLVGQLLTYDAAESAACMQCHAPMAEQREAFEAARHKAESHPFTDRGLADAGNSCGGCHLRSHRHFGPPQRDQGSDGRDPLPNEDVATGCCRDGPARTGLQPHAHHEHHRRPTAAGGDAGIVAADMCSYPVAEPLKMAGIHIRSLPDRKGRQTRQDDQTRLLRQNRESSVLLPERFHTTKTHLGHWA